MKELRIKYDFSNGPIWKDKYDVKTGEWSTGIDVIDNDESLAILNEEAEKEYSSLYSFDENGVLCFNENAFEEKKERLLSLIQSILVKIDSLNDGSFEVVDEETKKLML